MSDLDIGNPIIETNMAILGELKKYFKETPALQGGQRIFIPTHFGQVRHTDFFENPFQHIDQAKLPAITLSLANISDTEGVYIDRTPREAIIEEQGVKWGIISDPPEQMDLTYMLYFNTDNTTILEYFISKAITVFKKQMAYLPVHHTGDLESNCYDLDVTLWPQASGNVANLNNLYEASMQFTVRAIEFKSGEYERVPLITDYVIPLHKPDQEVIAYLNGANELIITIS